MRRSRSGVAGPCSRVVAQSSVSTAEGTTAKSDSVTKRRVRKRGGAMRPGYFRAVPPAAGLGRPPLLHFPHFVVVGWDQVASARFAPSVRAVPRPSFHPLYMNPRSPRHTPARPATAAHRPASVTIPAAAPINYAPNAALLIDFDNVTIGIPLRPSNGAQDPSLVGHHQGQSATQARVRRLAPLSAIRGPAGRVVDRHDHGTGLRIVEEERNGHPAGDIDALELVFTRPEIGT